MDGSEVNIQEHIYACILKIQNYSSHIKPGLTNTTNTITRYWSAVRRDSVHEFSHDKGVSPMY